MLSKLPVEEIDMTITVSSGTGTGTFSVGGEIIQAMFKTPNGTETYDWQLTDRDSFVLDGNTGLEGNTCETIGKSCTDRQTTMTITNGSADGDYPVRLLMRYGP